MDAGTAIAADAAMSSVSGVPVGFLAKGVKRIWQRKFSVALSVAAAHSGKSPRGFKKWLKTDPVAVPLYLTVLWAAGMNGHEETLRAMGAALGRAAYARAERDKQTFDRVELALRMMKDLLPQHFDVLVFMQGNSMKAARLEAGTAIHVTVSDVENGVGLTEDLAHQCLINLEAAGLVQSVALFDGQGFQLSPLAPHVIIAARAGHSTPRHARRR